MRIRTLVVAVAPLVTSVVVAGVATGQNLTDRERWVRTGPPEYSPPVPWPVVILGRDSVMELPFPNPSQGDPRWRVNNGNLETWDHRTGDTTSREFKISGDTMTVQGRGPPMRRVATGPSGHPPITGTWATPPVSMYRLVYYMTYRSDGRAIQDISTRDSTWWKSDSLFLVGRGTRRSYAFRKTTDTLYVTGTDGRVQPFVRKPWGCYNTEKSDSGVLECQ